MELVDTIFWSLLIVLLLLLFFFTLRKKGIQQTILSVQASDIEANSLNQTAHQKSNLPLIIVVLLILCTFFYGQYSAHKPLNDVKTNPVTQPKGGLQFNATQKDYLLAHDQYERVRFWGVTSVAGLLLVVVGLLINSVKSKAKTNIELTELNAAVSRQKDNLDRVNHHLEDIIDERTRDLLIKNKRLSETVNQLLSQINNPYANLKEMLILKDNELNSLNELFKSMRASVDDMDNFITEIKEDVSKVQADQ